MKIVLKSHWFRLLVATNAAIGGICLGIGLKELSCGSSPSEARVWWNISIGILNLVLAYRLYYRAYPFSSPEEEET